MPPAYGARADISRDFLTCNYTSVICVGSTRRNDGRYKSTTT